MSRVRLRHSIIVHTHTCATVNIDTGMICEPGLRAASVAGKLVLPLSGYIRLGKTVTAQIQRVTKAVRSAPK